jgi:hypothetical protein
MEQNATSNNTTEPPKDKEDKPNEYFLSELLQISMKELWEVLIARGLVKKVEVDGGAIEGGGLYAI